MADTAIRSYRMWYNSYEKHFMIYFNYEYIKAKSSIPALNPQEAQMDE